MVGPLSCFVRGVLTHGSIKLGMCRDCDETDWECESEQCFSLHVLSLTVISDAEHEVSPLKAIITSDQSGDVGDAEDRI